jgi:hypothetical protein
VDDQGLEASYTSLKPSKERRFSDIILIQYSKKLKKPLVIYKMRGYLNVHF